MDTRRAQELPAGLEKVRRRFEEWRETCEAHARIPDSLWLSAAVSAGRYGLSKTANALRVNYYALQRRLAAKAAADRRASKKRMGRRTAAGDRPERDGAAKFVELPFFAAPDSGECYVEWEDARGGKMRVRLRGVGTPDVAALGRSFWDRRP
jgi:hypothetical protein